MAGTLVATVGDTGLRLAELKIQVLLKWREIDWTETLPSEFSMPDNMGNKDEGGW